MLVAPERPEQPRKRRASTRTGRKKVGRQAIQRLPSPERPPPATTQCRCSSVWPQSVEDGEEAELCAEMLGIGGDRLQGFGGGVEQDVVDRSLVVMGDRGDLSRHGEDDMEVWHCEELGSSVVKPLGTRQGLALWAVAIAARVVADALVAAGIALLDVAAQRGRATLLDRRHDASLRRR
jgi:hypothetical protein